MHPIQLRQVTPQEMEALDHLYRTTRSARLRTRAQALLLAIEEKMVAPQIAAITRMSEHSIRRWIRRFNAEGVVRETSKRLCVERLAAWCCSTCRPSARG